MRGLLVGLILLSGSPTTRQSDALIIADFDGSKLESRSSLAIWPYADDQFGGTSDVKVSLIRPGARSSRGALHVVFRVTQDSPMPFAGVWMIVAKDGMPTDLTGYRGVRFFARSNDRDAFTAGIIQYRLGLRRYFTKVEIRSEWTLVELPFDTFRATGPASAPATVPVPLDGNDVTSVGISVAPQRSVNSNWMSTKSSVIDEGTHFDLARSRDRGLCPALGFGAGAVDDAQGSGDANPLARVSVVDENR